jgi:hypothetical protein
MRCTRLFVYCLLCAYKSLEDLVKLHILTYIYTDPHLLCIYHLKNLNMKIHQNGKR